MKTFVTVLTLLTFSSLSLAAEGSDSLWSITVGGSQYEAGASICQTLDGGFISVGTTESFGAGSYDVYAVRINANAETLWTKTYGGTGEDRARCIIALADGGFALSGWTDSYGAGGDDFYLIRIDKNGDTLWTKTYGTSYEEQCWGLDTTFDGGFILAGHRLISGTNYNGYVVRTDSNGDTIWTKIYAGVDPAFERFRSIISLSDSHFVCCGDTGIEQTAPWNRMRLGWVMKIDTSGSVVWSNSIGTEADEPYELFYSVVECFNGGFITGGCTQSYGAGGDDFFIAKINSNGDSLWAYAFGGPNGEECRSVIQCADSGFLAVGKTESFGNGQTFNHDLWVVKLDNTGDSVWSEPYGGSLKDAAEKVVQTEDREFVISGWTESYDAGNYDMWILKIGRDESPPDSIWSYSYGGENNDKFFSILHFDNDYIVAGINKSQSDPDGQAWVMRLDRKGQTVWETFFGDPNENLFEDVLLIANGDSIICGGATKTIFYDAYLAKLTIDGDSIWTKSYGGSEDDCFYSIDEDVDKNIIASGFSKTSSGFPAKKNAWLYLMNSEGDSIWAYSYGLNSTYQDCEFRQVISTSDTNYACTGFQGLGTGAPNEYSDFWFFKTDAGVDTIVDSTYSLNQYDYAYSLCETSTGGFVLAGNTITDSGDRDVMIIRIGGDGTRIWTKTYGGNEDDGAYKVREDSAGDYVISGYTYSYSAGEADFWLLKIDAMGDSVWSVRFGKSLTDICYDFCILNDSTYTLSGATYTSSNSDGWILKAGGEEGALNIEAWNRGRFYGTGYARSPWARSSWGR